MKSVPFAEARARWEALVAHDDERIGPRAGSYLLGGTAFAGRAVVLLHGLTASPAQCNALAAALHARGDTVLVPRLPHHGDEDRLTDRLAALTAQELTDFAREVYAIARGLGTHVTVAGFSLGGLLALWLAQHEDVDHAVAIAPFLGIAAVPTRARRLVATSLRALPNRFLWWDPLRRDRLGPAHGYPRFPTHAIAEALALAHGVGRAAEERAPRAHRITLITNASETAVSNRSARRLARAWRAAGYTHIAEHRLTGLPPSHDVVEPLRDPAVSGPVAQRIVALISADAPEPPW